MGEDHRGGAEGDGDNGYACAGNNPMVFTDPTGLVMSMTVNRATQTMDVHLSLFGFNLNYRLGSNVVTTYVVRDQDVSPNLPKGAMVNTNHPVTAVGKDAKPGEEGRYPTQFPDGTWKVTEETGKNLPYPGPNQLKTNASQQVQTNAGGTTDDSGYNIHFVDPTKATNTLGCIGIKDAAEMSKLLFLNFLENLFGDKNTTLTVKSGQQQQEGNSK